MRGLLRFAGVIVALSLGATGAASVAPVPPQIATAKHVFISNGGQDTGRLDDYSGHQDRCYNQFYAALKGWGRYQLADGPGDADLVMEIRFANPPTSVNVVKGDAMFPFDDPRFTLTIFDAKTHFVLWSLTEHAAPARLKSNRDKNFDQGLANLVDDLKQLAGPPAGGGSESK